MPTTKLKVTVTMDPPTTYKLRLNVVTTERTLAAPYTPNVSEAGGSNGTPPGSDLTWVAYHEAGHAVAAVRFGHDLRGVTIVPDEDSLGQVFGEGDFWDEKECKEYAVQLLVGYAADVLWFPARARRGACRASASDDFAKVQRHAAFLGVTIDTVIRWARDFARENRKAIRVVAEDILSSRTLDPFEVECLIEIADGKATVADLVDYRAHAAAFAAESARRRGLK